MTETTTLYGKYRPRKFEDVVAQPDTQIFINGLKDPKFLSHAYLVSGPHGTGKTTAARIFAMALNCERRGPGEFEPCGECDNCYRIMTGSWPDAVLEVDAASNRGIGDMKNLTQNIALSTTGNYRVYIIDESHMLTNEANNAILKVLEEPPANVIWILCTTDPQKMLATIRSRCTLVRMRDIAVDNIESIIKGINEKEGLELSAEQVHNVAVSGRGSARDAISNMQALAAGGSIENDDMYLLLDDCVANRDLAGFLVKITQMTDEQRGTFSPKSYLDHVQEMYRDSVVYGANPDLINGTMDDTRLGYVKMVSQANNARQVIRHLDLISQAQNRMYMGAKSDMSVLETCIASLIYPTATEQNKDLDMLIDEMFDELESQTKVIKSLHKTTKLLSEQVQSLQQRQESGAPVATPSPDPQAKTEKSDPDDPWVDPAESQDDNWPEGSSANDEVEDTQEDTQEDEESPSPKKSKGKSAEFTEDDYAEVVDLANSSPGMGSKTQMKLENSEWSLEGDTLTIIYSGTSFSSTVKDIIEGTFEEQGYDFNINYERN